LSSKPQSYNDNNEDDNDNDDKDAVIASMSKNDDDHDIVFFAVVGEATERQQWQRLGWQQWQQGCCDCLHKQEQWQPRRSLLCAGPVAAAAADKGVICPRRCPLTSPP
jgi:hypothetical protein